VIVDQGAEHDVGQFRGDVVSAVRDALAGVAVGGADPRLGGLAGFIRSVGRPESRRGTASAPTISGIDAQCGDLDALAQRRRARALDGILRNRHPNRNEDGTPSASFASMMPFGDSSPSGHADCRYLSHRLSLWEARQRRLCRARGDVLDREVVLVSAKTIEGKTFSLEDLFGSASYKIDYYQREYAWRSEDVSTLIEDFCAQFSAAMHNHEVRRQGVEYADPYFLGSFVYHESGGNSRTLVDGQQRFTTLHLIFVHLHRRARALGRDDLMSLLEPVIRHSVQGHWAFRINIPERRPALQAWYEGGEYELGPRESISMRNLCARSSELGDLLEERIEVDDLGAFVTWILTRVLMVGIEAPDSGSGFKIFESMNNRGNRLTPLDLIKSFLLSWVGRDQDRLNEAWREMLAELSSQQDPDGASRFLKSALVAQYARFGEGFSDVAEIGDQLHLWVRNNRKHLKLTLAPDFYEFVQRLLALARTYRTFLASSLVYRPEDKLEWLFFNRLNRLPNQMDLILAAIRPREGLSISKDKARLIAGFIDRWYVVRVLSDEPASAADLDVLGARLIPKLKSCKSADDVAAILVGEICDDNEFKTLIDYRLRKNNTLQIRYLLARLTSFVQVRCQEPDLTGEYLSDQRSWQIEHIFAKRPERHPKISDPLVFDSLRNRVGVLVLLSATINMSLQDATVEHKLVGVYKSSNLLARSLDKGFRQHNKPVRDLIREFELKDHLRHLEPDEDISSTVEFRQELYRRLCKLVWSPRYLGIPWSPLKGLEASVAAPQRESRTVMQGVGAAKPPPGRGVTDLQRMVRADVLTAGATLVGRAGAIEAVAEVTADGQLRVHTGDIYRNVNTAGSDITKKSCDGLAFWKLIRDDGSEISLRQLRDESPLGRSPRARKINSRR